MELGQMKAKLMTDFHENRKQPVKITGKLEGILIPKRKERLFSQRKNRRNLRGFSGIGPRRRPHRFVRNERRLQTDVLDGAIPGAGDPFHEHRHDDAYLVFNKAVD